MTYGSLIRRKVGDRLRGLTATLGLCAGICAILPATGAAATCASLANLVLPGTTITAAQDIPAGSFAGETNLPAFCRVTATLTPNPQSVISIEVWLPETGWNGRFEGVGGGGFTGIIEYGEMGPALQQGFAVGATDQGTAVSGCSPLYCGGNGNQGNVLAAAFGEGPAPTTGLYGQPERIKDFGYRAVHLMTVRAKDIVHAFYVRRPDHSYFSGCSTGGQNALMEAQRFPDDYDGIIAGAPANDRVNLHSMALWVWQATHATPSSLIAPAQMTLVNNAVLAQCGGQDGGLKSDPFLTDPRDCHFDPAVLQCKAGNSPPNCLNSDQVVALQKYYGGAVDPKTGQRVYVGYARGSETASITALGLVLNESLPEPGFDGLFYWEFGPSFGDPTSAVNYANFNFDTNLATINKALAPVLDANDADLSPFERHGGKLILFHGWADPLIPSQGTIDYYTRVVGGDGDYDRDDGHGKNFVRLFMAPGTYHCDGGPGPNVFGGSFNQGGPNDPQHSLIAALVRWVEGGPAPERVIATKYTNDDPTQPVVMQRPLCAFPDVARYKGSGDPTQADSFVCVRDEREHH